jgi:hypothetical protein
MSKRQLPPPGYGYYEIHENPRRCHGCTVAMQTGAPRPPTRFVFFAKIEAELLVYPPESCGGASQ